MLGLVHVEAFLGGNCLLWKGQTKPYVLGYYSGQFILNLDLTTLLFRRVFRLIQSTVKNNGKILFISNDSREINKVVKSMAIKHNQFYVEQSWVGGTLTNLGSVLKIIKNRKKEKKLFSYFHGIRGMRVLPDLIFVFHIDQNQSALREAQILNIPSVGFIDTSSDYSKLVYAIPGFSRSLRSVIYYSILISKFLK